MTDDIEMEDFKIDISQFKLSDNNIKTFNRITNINTDCVPNALFLIGAIDSKTTDILRIISEDTIGFHKPTIKKMFNYIFKRNFDFFKADKSFLYNYCHNELLPGHSIFCTVDKMLPVPVSHAILIAKTDDGRLVLLDGQQPSGLICEIKGEDSDCWKNYKKDVDYYIIQNLN